MGDIEINLLINSNTTLVSINPYPPLHFLHYMCHSNTTLVSINHTPISAVYSGAKIFKYNSCFY